MLLRTPLLEEGLVDDELKSCSIQEMKHLARERRQRSREMLKSEHETEYFYKEARGKNNHNAPSRHDVLIKLNNHFLKV